MMQVQERLRPSGIVEASLRPTTSGNKNIPIAIAHVDDTALHNDFRGVRIGSRDTSELGRHLLKPTVDGASRQSILQANTGGYLEANTKILGRNYFPYIMRPDDHHAPEDWDGLMRQVDIHRGYETGLMRRSGDVYRRVETQGDLDRAMAIEGTIAVVNTLEGLPRTLGDTSNIKAIEDLKKRGIQQIGLWNENTDFGDTHGTPEDHGLTRMGTALLEGCVENGIVLDVSHASPRSSEQMIKIAAKRGGHVVASHTGARINDVIEKSRNVTDNIARGVLESGGIVGVALSSGMLGGNRLEHVVAAYDHFASLGSGAQEQLVYGYDANGISLGTEIIGATTVVDLRDVGTALQESGRFTSSEVTDISWRNYYDHLHRTLPSENRAE